MFALADCNNFYASCERVFQPHLNGKPIVILSNNDGCVIARSNEAKALGIAMGAPYFKIEPYLKQENISVFSSNYALYGDMSQRVMQVLAEFAPRIEVYSIDECFLDFSGMPLDLTEYCQQLCATVKQWTGIPISIGIAPTKTLAKLANRLAKKGLSGSVLDWCRLENPVTVLETVPLEDIWGISRGWSAKLQAQGVYNALDLRNAAPKRMRQHFGVVMERIVLELGGISCMPLEAMPAPKQQIMTSRSFGIRLNSHTDLQAAITHFATRSAEKLRAQQLATQVLMVFLETSRFDRQHWYANNATQYFDIPTHDSTQLIAAAQRGLRRIYKQSYSYQRAGVLLMDLIPAGSGQTSLFEESDQTGKSASLMSALDDINRKHGKKTIRFGSELISPRWLMRQHFKSPSYTTRWQELLKVNI